MSAKLGQEKSHRVVASRDCLHFYIIARSNH
jgi:hypothetical protein